MAVVKFTLNGKAQTVDAAPAMPLLWVLRDTLGMTGTKFGCGMALCGACTVHINGQAVRSCVTPISAVAGKTVTTIEGLSAEHQPSHPAGLDRAGCAAVRLLPVRPDHDRGGAARQDLASPPTPISTKPCAATSAAAEPIEHDSRAIHRAAEIHALREVSK